MLIRHKPLFWFGAALLAVGTAFLILPPYGAYCESKYANDYYCATYEVAVALGAFVDSHAGSFTALATIAIAWFTLTLKRSTERNAQALINAENSFPFILIAQETISKLVATHGRWNKSPTMWDDEIARPAVGYFLKNYGRTAMLIQRISDQIIVSPTFPEHPEYSLRIGMPEELIVAPEKSSETLICTMKDKFTVGDAVRFQEQKTVIWFYGYIIFLDAFDERRRVTYRYRYMRGDGRLRLMHYRTAPEEET